MTECQRQCLGAPDQLDQGPLVKTARQLKANGRAAAVVDVEKSGISARIKDVKEEKELARCQKYKIRLSV
jgi:hypothetical protein